MDMDLYMKINYQTQRGTDKQFIVNYPDIICPLMEHFMHISED